MKKHLCLHFTKSFFDADSKQRMINTEKRSQQESLIKERIQNCTTLSLFGYCSFQYKTCCIIYYINGSAFLTKTTKSKTWPEQSVHSVSVSTSIYFMGREKETKPISYDHQNHQSAKPRLQEPTCCAIVPHLFYST